MQTQSPSSAFTRLYLVPIRNQQQIVDVPSDSLVLSDGKFVLPQFAQTLTLTSVDSTASFTPFAQGAQPVSMEVEARQEVRVCFKEPASVQQYPDTDVIEATDPSGGACICGITCMGTDLQYVKVMNVPPVV